MSHNTVHIIIILNDERCLSLVDCRVVYFTIPRAVNMDGYYFLCIGEERGVPVPGILAKLLREHVRAVPFVHHINYPTIAPCFSFIHGIAYWYSTH